VAAPDPPPKKVVPATLPEGVDPNDFEDAADRVAGLRIDDPPPPPPSPTPPAAAVLATPAEPTPEQPAPTAHLSDFPVAPATPPPMDGAAPVPTPATPPTYGASPYGYAPYPYSPYPGGTPAYGQYPPPGTYAQPAVYYQPLPPRVEPSPTVEGLSRLQAAALLGAIYFALFALHRAFEASTGITDLPGSRGTAGFGLQFLSYFLTACEAVAVAFAVAASSSALFRLRDGRGEFFDPPAEIPKRAYRLLGLSLTVPLAVGLAAWVRLSDVQRSLPGLGTGSSQGLALLFDEYRIGAVAVALAQLAAAFLLAVGLRGTVRHLAPLAPRKAFREFATLLVLASAVSAALLLVVLYALLPAPLAGQTPSARLEILALAVGPALSVVSFLRLRSYLAGLRAEAERRFKAKAAGPAKTG